MTLPPGSNLGPYEISAPLGAGGMGEVYRALDPRLGREVALKILPRDLTHDPERLVRFEREARSASALNHPNIVTIHEFAKDGDTHYLVMELIRGESLRDIIRRGPLPLKKVLAMSSAIASGLAAAHAAGIVHRDLKPENIVVTADGIPKIVDFGLVKSSQSSSPSNDAPTAVHVSHDGMIVGTLAYMSPEQASGAGIDVQSDQFAFGLIVYELATGKHPFRRATQFETLTAILNDPAPPLGETYPEPVAWVVERCLAKQPAERYASTTDLARDVAGLRDRLSVTSTNAPKAKPSRRATLIAAAAGAAAMAAIVFGVATIARRGEAVAPANNPIHAVVTTPQIDVHYGEVAVPVMISPDGRYIVASGTGNPGTNDLWLHDLGSGKARLIAENGYAPAWSPDSKAIAYFNDGKLKTVSLAGGPPHVVCDAIPEGTPAWSGNTILFVQYSGGPSRAGVYSVDASGGLPRLIAPASVGDSVPGLPWWPHFLPDGKRFLYTTLTSKGGTSEIEHALMLGALDGTAPRRLAAVDSRAVFAAGHILYVRDGTLVAQKFDLDNAQFSGEARPIVEDIHYFRSTGMAAFSVSDNGTLAWRSARRPSRLVWLDRSGAESAAIATAVFATNGRLSRDGSRYAVSVLDPKQGTGDIWVYGLERENSERLTFQLLDQREPVWAHDGETIYCRSDGQGGPPDIVELRPGADRPTILYQARGVESPEDVSPDGKWLLFSAYSVSAADVHMLPLDPIGPSRPFAITPFDEKSPRFSPDGKWIAYSSNVAGAPEIYVRLVSGGAPTRLSKQGGTRPAWSRDGRELFFLGPGGRLMSVAVSETFGDPRMLLQADGLTAFEPAPDGKRFLAHIDGRPNAVAVHVLVNWTAHLPNS